MRESTMTKPATIGSLRKDKAPAPVTDVPRGTHGDQKPTDPKAEADAAADLVGQNLTEPVECPECHGRMVKAGTLGVIYHKPGCSVYAAIPAN